MIKNIMVAILALTAMPLSLADSENENATLQLVINELDAIKPQIVSAKQAADSSARLQFNYAALLSDIKRIQSGIRAKIQHQTIQPRVVTPLKGDYLTLKATYLPTQQKERLHGH